MFWLCCSCTDDGGANVWCWSWNWGTVVFIVGMLTEGEGRDGGGVGIYWGRTVSTGGNVLSRGTYSSKLQR